MPPFLSKHLLTSGDYGGSNLPFVLPLIPFIIFQSCRQVSLFAASILFQVQHGLYPFVLTQFVLYNEINQFGCFLFCIFPLIICYLPRNKIRFVPFIPFLCPHHEVEPLSCAFVFVYFILSGSKKCSNQSDSAEASAIKTILI